MDEGLSQLYEDVDAVDEEMTAEGALPYDANIRAEYESARQAYETSTQDVLNQIQKARDLLLSQPTQKSKGEMLRGLAMSLAAPRERSDPRFYEKRNLYTFLRDVGEYGTAEAEAQKKAELMQKEQLLKLDELAAKYGQQGALERLKAVGPLYRQMMKPKAEDKPPLEARSLKYYRGVLADPNASPEDKADAQIMVKKILSEPTEKPTKQTWNDRLVQAYLRESQGKATPEDKVVISIDKGKKVTPRQEAKDREILEAREKTKNLNDQELRSLQLKSRYDPNAKETLRLWNLAQRPTYQEMLDDINIEASSNVIEEEMP